MLEVRPPVDADKGTAVRHLVREAGVARALFAGDDTTDLDAFRGLREAGLELAVCVAVRSATRGRLSSSSRPTSWSRGRPASWSYSASSRTSSSRAMSPPSCTASIPAARAPSTNPGWSSTNRQSRVSTPSRSAAIR